jgi:hypothetical protein
VKLPQLQQQTGTQSQDGDAAAADDEGEPPTEQYISVVGLHDQLQQIGNLLHSEDATEKDTENVLPTERPTNALGPRQPQQLRQQLQGQQRPMPRGLQRRPASKIASLQLSRTGATEPSLELSVNVPAMASTSRKRKAPGVEAGGVWPVLTLEEHERFWVEPPAMISMSSVVSSTRSGPISSAEGIDAGTTTTGAAAATTGLGSRAGVGKSQFSAYCRGRWILPCIRHDQSAGKLLKLARDQIGPWLKGTNCTVMVVAIGTVAGVPACCNWPNRDKMATAARNCDGDGCRNCRGIHIRCDVVDAAEVYAKISSGSQAKLLQQVLGWPGDLDGILVALPYVIPAHGHLTSGESLDML